MHYLTSFLTWLSLIWRRLFGTVDFEVTEIHEPRRQTYRSIVEYGAVHRVKSQAQATSLLSGATSIIIVEGAEGPKWLLMRCPDECGEIRRISLSAAVPPAWDFQSEADGTISLYPSVRLTSGCRVHFILRHNKAYVI
jgi:hypothetical protein